MNKTSKRHFPYQHPTFGTEKKPKPKTYWENTIYFVWWSYLKRSEKYLETCESGGKVGLVDLYNDFGDVRGDDFKKWWTEGSRGMKLFSEPHTLSTLKIMAPDEVVEPDDSVVFVRVPLSLPKQFLVDRFTELIGKHHQGKRGRQYARESKAKYRFRGQPNLQGLKTALAVYDYKVRNPSAKLWEIGGVLTPYKSELDECRKKKVVPSYDLKRKIEATVSRYLRKAKISIENTNLGMFP